MMGRYPKCFESDVGRDAYIEIVSISVDATFHVPNVSLRHTRCCNSQWYNTVDQGRAGTQRHRKHGET